MSRVVLVIPQDKFRDEELFEPLAILKANGHDVVIASNSVGEVQGDLGGKIRSELPLKEVDTHNFDAIGVIGGSGTAAHLWDDLDLRKTLQDFSNQDKLVTGICAGTITLARAGLLHGLQATTYPAEGLVQELTKQGAQYREEHVVIDGSIITADGPQGAAAYGRALVTALA